MQVGPRGGALKLRHELAERRGAVIRAVGAIAHWRGAEAAPLGATMPAGPADLARRSASPSSPASASVASRRPRDRAVIWTRPSGRCGGRAQYERGMPSTCSPT